MADPFAGYSFDVNSPAVLDAPVGGDGSFAAAGGVDLVMPINLGPGAEFSAMPMHGLIMSGKLSADQGCIGTFNAENLDPANNRLPDDQTLMFMNGGALSAHVLLAEADAIDITVIGQSLRPALGRPDQKHGDGAMPISRCTRDADMNIVFKGDWCDATDMAADANCFDSVRLTADFLAATLREGELKRSVAKHDVLAGESAAAREQADAREREQ